MRVLELTAHIKSISRAGGRSATAAAAYRACTRIVDEREGVTHDYRRKRGLEAAEIILPSGAPDWAADRAALWNAAELRERNGKRGPNAGRFKADAVVAREFLFGFPAELSPAGRLAVARSIARHLADAHRVAVDIALHQPGAEGDERNHHCHILTTTRRLTATGLGAKAREWSDLKSGAALTRAFRQFLAETLNAALAAEGKAGLVHVEHRSLKARGSPRRPTRHQGPARTHAQRNDRRRRADWRRSAVAALHDRHAAERAALKTRQDAALAAKLAHLADRERKGVSAIKAELDRQQAVDRPTTGTRRIFDRATGQAARADLERQTRMAERAAAAEGRIAALKAAIATERAAYQQAHANERADLHDRQGRDHQQLGQAAAARLAFDRAAEVHDRRKEVQEISLERLPPNLSPARDGRAPG